jgi:hypothetical protein
MFFLIASRVLTFVFAGERVATLSGFFLFSAMISYFFIGVLFFS